MNYLILPLLLMLTSCLPTSYNSEWLGGSSIVKLRRDKRTPAQFNECFVDQWDHAKVRRSINSLEDIFLGYKSSSKNNQGYALNSAEQYYLDNVPSGIQSKLILPDNCRDLICLLNLPYQDASLSAGVRLYHWFLVTGQYVDNTKVNFQPNELLALSLITGVLPPSVLNSQKDFVEKGKELSHGIFQNKMVLPEGDTTLSNKLFEGDFYESYFHELGHSIDTSLTSKAFSLRQSLNPLWYMTNWSFEEGISRDIPHFKFQYKNRNTLPVKAKIKDHPSEEWSQMVADSFLRPNDHKLLGNESYSLVIDRVWNGQGNDQKSLSEKFIAEIKTTLFDQLGTVIRSCLADKNEDKHTIDFDCIDHRVERIVGEVIASQKKSHYFGCSFWDSSKELGNNLTSWGVNLYKDVVKKHSLTSYTVDTFTKKKEVLFKKILTGCDPQGILFSSFSNTDPSLDYKERLQACISRFESENKGLFTLLKSEIIGKYPYAKVMDDAILNLNQTMITVAPKIKYSVDTLIAQCSKNMERYSGELLLNPFNGGSIYVEKNMLNCINSSIPLALDKILKDQLSDRYYLAKKGLAFAESILLPRFLNGLKNAFWEIHKKEQLLFKELNLLENNTIVMNLYNKHAPSLDEESSDYYRTCHERIVPELIQTLKTQTLNHAPIYTMASHEQATILAQEYCFKIKTHKQSERGLELANIQIKIKKYVEKIQFQKNIPWFSQVRSFDSWSNTCKEQLSIDISPQVIKLFKSHFKYFNRKYIVDLGLSQVCDQLKKDFVTSMTDFTKKQLALDLARKYETIIKKDLLWLGEKTQKEMMAQCEGTYHSLLKHEIIDENLSQLSDSVKAKLLAQQICHRGQMVWRDLQIALKEVDPRCVKNCWTELAYKVEEYFVSLDEVVWKFMNDRKDDKLILHLTDKLGQTLDAQINNCLVRNTNQSLVQIRGCLESKVFTSQNFSNIVRTIYPEKKRMLSEHLQKLNSVFQQRTSTLPKILARIQ